MGTFFDLLSEFALRTETGDNPRLFVTQIVALNRFGSSELVVEPEPIKIIRIMLVMLLLIADVTINSSNVTINSSNVTINSKRYY